MHNFKRLQLTFETPRIYEIRDRNMLGIVCGFLKTIALENKMSHEQLVDILTQWYFKMNHKKLGLICYGFTNSSKFVSRSIENGKLVLFPALRTLTVNFIFMLL